MDQLIAKFESVYNARFDEELKKVVRLTAQGSLGKILRDVQPKLPLSIVRLQPMCGRNPFLPARFIGKSHQTAQYWIDEVNGIVYEKNQDTILPSIACDVHTVIIETKDDAKTILQCIDEEMLSVNEGKMVIPKGFFVFMWDAHFVSGEHNGNMVKKYAVIRAETFETAILLFKNHILGGIDACHENIRVGFFKDGEGVVKRVVMRRPSDVFIKFCFNNDIVDTIFSIE